MGLDLEVRGVRSAIMPAVMRAARCTSDFLWPRLTRFMRSASPLPALLLCLAVILLAFRARSSITKTVRRSLAMLADNSRGRLPNERLSVIKVMVELYFARSSGCFYAAKPIRDRRRDFSSIRSPSNSRL